MRTLRYVLCDVFTSRPLEGNQLAVFTDARGVPPGLMQRLASEMNLSETTFVLPPTQGGHASVRIFTPRMELPFAGHPVLGTALVIGSAMEAREVRLELAQGIVPVAIEREGARANFGWMQQPLPQRLGSEQPGPERRRPEGPDPEDAELLAALGLTTTRLPPQRWTNGPEHVIVPVHGRAEVVDLTPDLGALARLAGANACVSVFAWDEAGVKTRMFAPGAGVAEDPATGSAAGVLGAYLYEQQQLPAGETLRIEQGAEVGRPSELFVRIGAEGGQLQEVAVGGGVQVVARGEFRLSF